MISKDSPLHIQDLRLADQELVEQTARVLSDGFRGVAPGSWGTLASARKEIHAMAAEGRISRVALVDGNVVGWIGGIPEYDGQAWELHPLVVDERFRGQGIGRALVADLEAQVRARGAMTLFLGSDDHVGQTTLARRDLYPDVLGEARLIANPGRHAYEFYQKCGFVIVGVFPDANGYGKPDIFLAKRVGTIPEDATAPTAAPRQPLPAWLFAVVLVRDGDKFLLIQETKFDQTWYLPAGHIEAGEDFLAAAKREVMEEAGVEVQIDGVLRVEHTPSPTGALRVRLIFTASVLAGETPKQHADEHSLQAGWFRRDEAASLPLRSRQILELMDYALGGGYVASPAIIAGEDGPYEYAGTDEVS